MCGFGATISINGRYGFQDWVTQNFSSQGCDAVGLYVYASESAQADQAPTADAVNWSMDGLLDEMFSSLQQRGWDGRQVPLIGIVQAFGGARSDSPAYRVVPNAKAVETQSDSFCAHGASGLVFYGWNDSSFGPATQTPLNNGGIATGIRNGIAACQHHWGTA